MSMSTIKMSNQEKAKNYRAIGRSLLKLHDQGQNLLLSKEITYEQFCNRSEFYQAKIMAYQVLEQACITLVSITEDKLEAEEVYSYKEVTWREFIGAFQKDNRYCGFSYNALVAMYHHHDDKACFHEEVFDLDVEYLTKHWNEYDSISDIVHAKIGENDIPVTEANIDSLRKYEMITPTLEQLRIYAEVIELPNDALLVQWY
tara:strand:+ start:436 stop:1041 length:606 start_codon:yes stop_codon:yes gene_type:complete